MGDSTVPPFLQVAMQVALVVTQVCTSMWYIFANGTFEYIHPIVFASIRGLICTATLIPIALVVDRKYKYSDEKAHDGWMGTILSKIPQQKPMVLLAANGAALTINQVVRNHNSSLLMFIKGIHCWFIIFRAKSKCAFRADRHHSNCSYKYDS